MKECDHCGKELSDDEAQHAPPSICTDCWFEELGGDGRKRIAEWHG